MNIIKIGMKLLLNEYLTRDNESEKIVLAPESAVKFYTYEKTKSYTCNDPRDLRVHHRYSIENAHYPLFCGEVIFLRGSL